MRRPLQAADRAVIRSLPLDRPQATLVGPRPSGDRVLASPLVRVVAMEAGQRPTPTPSARRPGCGCHDCGRRRGARPDAPPRRCPALPTRPPCRLRRGRCSYCGGGAGAPGLRWAQLRRGADWRRGGRSRPQAEAGPGHPRHACPGCGAEAQHGRPGPHLPAAPARLGEPAPRTGGRAAQPPGEARRVPGPSSGPLTQSCGLHPRALLHLLSAAAACVFILPCRIRSLGHLPLALEPLAWLPALGIAHLPTSHCIRPLISRHTTLEAG